MYNLRYHIASLVAVFLALALGLLLGSIVVQAGVLKATRDTLVSSLNKDRERMMTDRDRYKGQANALSAFAGEAWLPLAKDVLAGRTIFVIVDSSSGEAAKSAADAVKASGGTPVTVTFATPGLGLTDSKVTSALSQATGTTMDEKATASALAAEWSSVESTRPVTHALLSAGVLRFQGLTDISTVNGALITAFAGPQPDEIALAVGHALQETRRPAVAIEVSGKRFGMTKASATAGISSVDDAETPLGRLSMVWILAGRADGHFGTSPEAEAAYPMPLFPTK